MTDLTQNVIKELLDYDSESGKLFWKIRDEKYFNPKIKTKEQAANAWNARYAGTEALASDDGNGYLSGAITLNNNVNRLLSHRVIWFWNFGIWPENIDHIDHNKKNNKLENLRNVSTIQNSHNVSKHSTNKSGITGVSHRLVNGIWTGKWRAICWNNGKRTYLGDFNNKEDAIFARKAFLEKVGTYHPNHGI